MRYLTAQEILAIHFDIIEQIGGLHGIREIGLLASIVEKPKTDVFGKRLYPGIFMKAAVYYEALASYHVFIDGNKRTALTAAARFLYKNGYNLMVDNKVLEKFTLEVAIKQHSLKAIAAWLKKHSRKIRS